MTLLWIFLIIAQVQMPEIARVIDGSKTPEDIPDHAMWDMGFSFMNHLKTKNVEAGLATLPLSPADADLAFAEAALQIKRRSDCSDKGDRVFAAFKGNDKKIEEELQKLALECRWATLEAADRLLARMSDEGRVVLLNWMKEGRKKIQLTVPKGHEEFYRLPR